jgi:hypothetical protein
LIAKPGVQLRKSYFQDRNILGRGCLKFRQVALVHPRNGAGLDVFEQLDQPVSLLVPILSAHPSLPCLHWPAVWLGAEL